MFNAANRKRPFNAVGDASSSSSSSSTKNNDNKVKKEVASKNDGNGSSSNIRKLKSSTPPTTIVINGIEIHFPFEPYAVQRDYMKGVISALQSGTNALLESPTGTGKTLCLLCAALAWQRHEKGRIAAAAASSSQQQPLVVASTTAAQKVNNDNDDLPFAASDIAPNNSHSSSNSSNNPPVIIYASRTHSQLSQVVNELRNTRYRPKHAVLGSREHMCIHPKVNRRAETKNNESSSLSNNNDYDSAPKRSSTEVNNGCNKLNNKQGRKCQFRNNLDENSVWKPPPQSSLTTNHSMKSELPNNHNNNNDDEQPVLDMEDLVRFGKISKICPYYHTRSLLKDNPELIFVPYNYLFDRDARESTFGDNVNFDNAILIFDEAHNLEEFASESTSFDLSSADVAGCVSEVQRAVQYIDMQTMNNNGDTMSRQNVLSLKSVFLRFEKYLVESTSLIGGGSGRDGNSSSSSSSHPGEYIFDIYEQGLGITNENLQIFITFVRQLCDFIMESSGNNISSSSSGTPKLDHFINCLKRAFGNGTHLLALARAKSYRVHITKMTTTTGSNKNSNSGGFVGGRTISYWCFAPALAMRELSFLKVRSIIITSGTLSPLPSCAMELGLKFPVQLENDHVIQPDQIYVRVIGKGVSGKELSSKFGRRDDPEYVMELGNTLASLCGNIPGGVLVFFPSYCAMETSVQSWGGPASSAAFGGRKSGGSSGAYGKGAAFFAGAARKKQASTKCVFPMVPTQFRSTTDQSLPWQRLLARKAIVLEPRSTSELSDAISEYKRFIVMPKSSGAILMGVCRGKISEGIDFSDDMCRAVIVTGLPFAPYLDPKVKLKREFLDAARASAKSRPSLDGGFGHGKLPPTKVDLSELSSSATLSGAEWYNQQALRACNQAIGRVIRHRNDYGAVILLDHRFADVRNRDGLSKWLRPHLRNETFGASTRGLVQFYRESKARAEKARAFNRPMSPDRPVIKYENSDESINLFSKVAVVKTGSTDEDALSNGYIPEDLLMERYDLNHLPAARLPGRQSSEEDCGSIVDRNVNESTRSSGLGAFYNKEMVSSDERHATQGTNSSSFGGIDTEPRGSDFSRSVVREQVKRRIQQQGKKSDNAAILKAKIFFAKAKDTLSRDDLLNVNKMLVAMKQAGDSKNEQQYVKIAKELVSVLADNQLDKSRLQMIVLLFPLLPIKYRYKIEKLAATLVLDRSPLNGCCKDKLPEGEFSTMRSFIESMIFNTSSTHDSIASTEREFLEDSQRIIDILVINDVNLQLLYDLLPERQLRKVQTLALELERSRNVSKAREKSAILNGDDCINSVLFRPPVQKSLAPSSTQVLDPIVDAESQRIMTEALSHGFNTNRQRKDMAIDNQKKAELITLNPNHRTALHDSMKMNLAAKGNGGNAHTSKRVNNATGVMTHGNVNDQFDMIERCLDQVKSDGFVQPQTKIQRINGKLNAHVPKGWMCIVCNESLKEVCC